MPPTITVNGDAEVPSKPDLAIVRMGAEMQAETAQAAQDQVNQVMTKATAAVRELGIAEVDIQTSGLNLYPVYAPPNREQQQRGEQGKVIGYRAGNVLEIRVDDIFQYVTPRGIACVGAAITLVQGDSPERMVGTVPLVGDVYRTYAKAVLDATNRRLAAVRGGSAPPN